MTTIYVSNLNGNDVSGDGSEGNPWATITKAVSVASSDNIIEIIDEETYNEGDITIPGSISNLTIQHTASDLGRPAINPAGDSKNRSFYFSGNGTSSFIGLEMVGVQGHTHIRDGYTRRIIMDNCFLHGATSIIGDTFGNPQAFGAITGGSHNDPNFPSIIKNSVIYFLDQPPAVGGAILAITAFEMFNCLLTSSYSTPGNYGGILYGQDSFGNNNVTASFCTLIKRNDTVGGSPVVGRWGKITNCIVSGAFGSGIWAEDHTYNLVTGSTWDSLPNRSFFDNSGNPGGSLGTGDIIGNATFVDNTAIGSSPAIAANYALVEGSLGVDQGIEFNSIFVDITGTIRPQGAGYDMGAFELLSPTWNDYDDSETYNRKFGSGFEIHGTANKLTTRTFPNGTTGRQVPYFVTIPGPANLRRRTTPYKNET